MSHIFHTHDRKRLTSEERMRLLAPAETLSKLGFKAGMTFADIGCGTGLFTFPAAEITGPQTPIFAVDVSPEMLEDVKAHILETGSTQITTVLSDAYNFKLEDNIANFVLICTVLHEIDDKIRFLNEAHRILKPGGIVAIIEFGETEAGFGPPIDHRLKEHDVVTFLSEARFTIINTIPLNQVFYAVCARK